MKNIYLTLQLLFFGLFLSCNNNKVKSTETQKIINEIKIDKTKEFFSLVKPINKPQEPLYTTLYDEYSISIKSNSSSQELILKKENVEVSKVLKFYYENPEIVFHLYKSNFDNIVLLIEGRDYYSSNLGVYYLESKSDKILTIDETLTYKQDDPEAKGFKLPNVEILKNVDDLKCKFYLGDKFLFYKDYNITNIETKKNNSSEKKAITNNINQYLINKDYFIKTFDINKDGIDDKIVSHNRYQGDELLIFLGESRNNYNFALKTINFSTDGGNQISDITETEQGFKITTSFPDRGDYKENYQVVFKNNTFILNTLETFSTSWQDGYKETCTITNIDFNLNHSKDELLNILSKKDKYCVKVKL